ncbi:NAD(P)H-dependent amine dehydrogenase family protein [Mycobacterium montefiorense]|uniref:Dihydrodipicolinate reductase n=1 Tax=Mycobacterium montefiorense TaxID=154654 RepID=A0AA37PKS0_9MYCO|nr:dihydrodipicolinate reductase [Mycobacterium montefiorense]GBG39252.1 dihydrodipicolinate reductase [Mycobacterium montefiorense]GKU37275.1 dihydrodipicolinate reductase [Mycobacterium montefiorense]GKU41923.1 dihydrodipicolinate reductase [Mycobacterium montefiorense]GKU45615.1 dihydrodipicolinate reductase [Mycobacterium montefiorense]GKU53423.1 dihydrodipicolinate reductase [Mycobacterium montefiorense]
MTYRVVQWTTGNVGKSSVKAIAANQELELVGCYAWSPEKAGRDVGELCGLGPLNVKATNDIEELLALKPDCVVYNPMFADVDELVRILRAGVNVVGTAEFITGHFLGAGRDRIAKACEQGGSTIFGTGINPGFIQLFTIVSAGLSDRVDKVSVLESFDTTIYNSPATEIPMGFGYPIDQPDLPAITKKGSGIFGDGVLLLADALGVELDEVRCEAQYAQTTEDLHLPGDWTIAKGCVAGIHVRWKGILADREIIEIGGQWRKGQALEPDWPLDMGYTIEVQGRPTIKTTLSFLPPRDFEGETLDDFIMLGLTITAVPAITAIPAVVAASPGIATYNDLPLLLPRGVLHANR